MSDCFKEQIVEATDDPFDDLKGTRAEIVQMIQKEKEILFEMSAAMFTVGELCFVQQEDGFIFGSLQVLKKRLFELQELRNIKDNQRKHLDKLLRNLKKTDIDEDHYAESARRVRELSENDPDKFAKNPLSNRMILVGSFLEPDECVLFILLDPLSIFIAKPKVILCSDIPLISCQLEIAHGLFVILDDPISKVIADT
jgi:hypothetical protein